MKLSYFAFCVLLIAFPLCGGAQTVIPVSDGDTTIAARNDTVAIAEDSIAAAGDSLLPWAERVRQRIDRLVAVPMFETSLTGIGVSVSARQVPGRKGGGQNKRHNSSFPCRA